MPGKSRGGTSGGGVAGAAGKNLLTPAAKNFKVGKAPPGGKGKGNNPPANQPMSGPVDLKPPAHYTKAEKDQFREYAQGGNNAIKNGHISSSGKVPSGKGTQLRKDSSNAAARERARAARTGNPYQKGDVAAHLPDATWLGRGDAPAYGHHTSRVNTAISNQQQKYPPGYKPTQFNVN